MYKEMRRAALLLLGTVTLALVCGGIALAANLPCDMWNGQPCQVVGTPNDDGIYGTKWDDSLSGEGGDDGIHGRGGNDTLHGGDGNDTVLGDGQISAGPPGEYGVDRVFGEGGNDWVDGSSGDDYLDGGDGNDDVGNDRETLGSTDVQSDSDTMHGGAGDDHLMAGWDGHDKIYGEDGDDYVNALTPDIHPLGSLVEDMDTKTYGSDTVDCGPGVDYVTFDEDQDGNAIDNVTNCETLEITELQLEDPVYARNNPASITGYAPLRYLSADAHTYRNEYTIIPGSIGFSGRPGDTLTSVELEVLVDGAVRARGHLSPRAEMALLNRPFPESGVLSATVRPLNVDGTLPLFMIPSAQLAALNTNANRNLTLRVKARMHHVIHGDDSDLLDDKATREYSGNRVQQLVLYRGNNRYLGRDEFRGGDGWVLPSIRARVQAIGGINRGTRWGDFSDMNGGSFEPSHASHQEGRDVDGDGGNPSWYNARDAAVADRLLAILNSRNGRHIERIWVTFNAPGERPLTCEGGGRDTDHSAFFRAIQGEQVPARGGGTRLATNVIDPEPSHCRHFHIRFFQP